MQKLGRLVIDKRQPDWRFAGEVVFYIDGRLRYV